AKSNAKGVKKKMPYETYNSKVNSEFMVHISTLKWIMDNSNSIKSFGVKDMMKSGFDTYLYTDLLAINPFAPIDSIPKATTVKNVSNTIKVTIPEGLTVPQIFTLLSKKGVSASEESLYDAMNNYDFSSYSLVSEIDRDKNKCYYLEGYLYPDTYEFYRLSSGTSVIGKLLKNSEAKATQAYRAKAAELSLTWEEVLIIASLVEKEAGKKEFMADVSSVIHNRLKAGKKLQLDATIYYVERYIKPYLSEDINRYNSDYNTYKCPALPAGPICNPGKAAIEAALNPAVTENYFFYSDENGQYHFSKDLVTVSP
ncbi:MAG: mltG, partial [Anaerocolumna sp.]|nr:mltG [Anaerocolumna sp.]